MISQSEGWLFKPKTYPVLVDEYPGVVCCTSQIYHKYGYSHIHKCAFVFAAQLTISNQIALVDHHDLLSTRLIMPTLKLRSTRLIISALKLSSLVFDHLNPTPNIHFSICCWYHPAKKEWAIRTSTRRENNLSPVAGSLTMLCLLNHQFSNKIHLGSYTNYGTQPPNVMILMFKTSFSLWFDVFKYLLPERSDSPPGRWRLRLQRWGRTAAATTKCSAWRSAPHLRIMAKWCEMHHAHWRLIQWSVI